MADLQLLTVRALRELAKKHLGTGHSRLKTKAELIAALAKVLPQDEEPKVEAKRAAPPAPSKPAKKEERKDEAPSRLEAIAAKYIRGAAKPPEEPKPEVVAKKAAPAAPAPVDAPIAKVIQLRPPPKAAEAVPVVTAKVATPPEPTEAKAVIAPKITASSESAQVEAAPAESAKTQSAKTASEPPPKYIPSKDELALIAENLGELPVTYGHDDVTLLARDPHTLWVSWDFARQTERRAHEGMSHAMPVLRLFDGVRLVREVEVALEARSWYIYNVIPGHNYRAEIHYVAPAGRSKQLGPASNPILVPPEGPSPVLDTHFVALPPIAPLPRPPAPPPEPYRASPFPEARRDELISLAERMLRDEPPTPVVPLSETDSAAPSHASSSAPSAATSTTGTGSTPGREEVRVRTSRRLGSSDLVSERYRVWIPGGPPDQRVPERSRFGGRWTSSRPA